eukprot:115928_1
MRYANCYEYHDPDCNKNNMLYFAADKCEGCCRFFYYINENEFRCCTCDFEIVEVYDSCCGIGCNVKLCELCFKHPETFNERFHREYAPCIQCGYNFCVDCCVHNHMASCVCNTCFDEDSEECVGKCGKKLNACDYNMYQNWGGQARDCCNWRDKCYICESCYGLTCDDCNHCVCIRCESIYCIQCMEYKETFGCNECYDEDNQELLNDKE